MPRATPVPKARRTQASAAVASMATAAVSKTAYQINLKDPGPHVGMAFNKKIGKTLDGLYLMDGPNVSLQGIEDMLQAADDLTVVLNRAHAKEYWRTADGKPHKMRFICAELLALVLDSGSADYDPAAEPDFTVRDRNGAIKHVCTAVTSIRGTQVDMGKYGSVQLRGRGWVYSCT